MTDNGFIRQTTVGVDQIIDSTRQNLIYITEDKLRLILYQYEESLKKRKAFWAPLGVLITIIVTLLSAEFRNWVLSAETWRCCFIVFAGILSVNLLISAVVAFKTKKKDIVEEIRNWGFTEDSQTPR